MSDLNKINLLLLFDKAPEEAVAYLESLNIKVAWNWQEQLKAIKEKAFTISKITNAALLQDIHDQLISAVKEGTSYDEFKTKVEEILKNRGYLKKEDGSQWRLDTIYRTNLQTSYMAGRYEQQQEVINEFPYREFIAITDNRTTDGCLQLNGTVLPANDPFWSINYPPRHFNCRSRVVMHNDTTLELYNKKVSDPASYRNVKPAEGFDHLLGVYKPDISKFTPVLQKKLKRVI